jgi:hypothetical protein
MKARRSRAIKKVFFIIVVLAAIAGGAFVAVEGLLELDARIAPQDYEYRWVEREPVEICALSGYVATEGTFYLGSGSFEQSPGYRYAREFDQGTRAFVVSEGENREIYVKEISDLNFVPHYTVKVRQARSITQKHWTIFSSSHLLVGEWVTPHDWDWNFRETWTFEVPAGSVYMEGKLETETE